MSNDTSEKNERGDCSEFEKCLKVLHLMLDNEASKEQEAYLKDHLDHCLFCFEQYQVEKQIRELLKAKCENLPVPPDLAQSIRNKVFASA